MFTVLCVIHHSKVNRKLETSEARTTLDGVYPSQLPLNEAMATFCGGCHRQCGHHLASLQFYWTFCRKSHLELRAGAIIMGRADVSCHLHWVWSSLQLSPVFCWTCDSELRLEFWSPNQFDHNILVHQLVLIGYVSLLYKCIGSNF